MLRFNFFLIHMQVEKSYSFLYSLVRQGKASIAWDAVSPCEEEWIGPVRRIGNPEYLETNLRGRN